MRESRIYALTGEEVLAVIFCDETDVAETATGAAVAAALDAAAACAAAAATSACLAMRSLM